MSATPPTSFQALDLDTFTQRLAGAEPTPGGGTGAAVAGALGAALVRMLCMLSVGRPKYAAHEALREGVQVEGLEGGGRRGAHGGSGGAPSMP
ncbi:MAG: cyclodeaminase/cyclohydrolase family protein, partial [Planctomycetia bacterium]